MASFVRPPSNIHTGWFVTFPLISQSAISIALIAAITDPFLPYAIDERYIFSNRYSVFKGFSPTRRPFNLLSIICFVISGDKPALPIPMVPSSVSISTTNQLKKRNGACESFWNGNKLKGVAKTVSPVLTGPFHWYSFVLIVFIFIFKRIKYYDYRIRYTISYLFDNETFMIILNV